MSSVGLMMLGGNAPKLDPNQFWRTPAEVTGALIALPVFAEMRAATGDKVWEPSCGEGHMAEPMLDAGMQVLATDLVDRGYGTGGIDFLKVREAWAPAIVTNPPFKHAGKFINHAEHLGIEWMALLLPANFWHASSRLPVFERWKPTWSYALTWRVDFLGLGRPVMSLNWNVWTPERPTETKFRPLARPA